MSQQNKVRQYHNQDRNPDRPPKGITAGLTIFGIVEEKGHTERKQIEGEDGARGDGGPFCRQVFVSVARFERAYAEGDDEEEEGNVKERADGGGETLDSPRGGVVAVGDEEESEATEECTGLQEQLQGLHLPLRQRPPRGDVDCVYCAQALPHAVAAFSLHAISLFLCAFFRVGGQFRDRAVESVPGGVLRRHPNNGLSVRFSKT